MTTTGHPIETKTLMAQRAAQRMVLRRIPDWILERLLGEQQHAGFGELDLATADGVDVGLAELALREKADVAMMSMHDLLARYRDSTDAQALKAGMRAAINALSGGLPAPLEDAWAAASNAAQEKYAGKLDDIEVHDTRYLACLLILADAFAEDGYRDPRL